MMSDFVQNNLVVRHIDDFIGMFKCYIVSSVKNGRNYLLAVIDITMFCIKMARLLTVVD